MKIPDFALARLPSGIDSAKAAVKRSTLAGLCRWVDVIRLEGRSAADGRPATVVVAARFVSSDFLLDRLFDGPVRETFLGRCWLGALPKRLAAADAAADVTIARVSMGAGDRLFGDDYLRVPELVDAEIVVPAPGARWPRHNSARSNQRRVAKNGLTWSTTTDVAEFDRFHHDFYVPFVQNRFGERGYALPRDELRYRFAHGCLQWIKHGDEVIAGQLIQFMGDRMRCVVIGLPGDGESARKLGAAAASKLFAVEYAQQFGFRIVSLGSNDASLCDPVLVSKRYWGVEIKARRGASHDMLLRWPAWSPLVAHLLAEAAPILRDSNRLMGLTADPAAGPMDEATLRQAGRRVGVAGLALLGVAGGTAGDSRPGHRVVVDGLPIMAVAPGSSRSIRDELKRGGVET